jgi:hypothetical protein
MIVNDQYRKVFPKGDTFFFDLSATVPCVQDVKKHSPHRLHFLAHTDNFASQR